MSVWKEKDPSIKRGGKLTSTTGEPEIEITYSGAPAGVCPGARFQARAGGDRARRRLRNEALTSGLQPSLSSMAFADFTRKGWRARSNGSFPWSRSWLAEECRGPSGYAGMTNAPRAPIVLLPTITAWGLLISARKALKPTMQGIDSGASAEQLLRLTMTGIPLVGKLEIFFATLWSKHISDFHKRWGNGGSFDWFAADYLMYSGNYGMF